MVVGSGVEAYERLFTERVRGVKVRDLELDEVWAYKGKHQKRILERTSWWSHGIPLRAL